MATLASSNRRSENVIVGPIIVLELAFGNIERKIFAADLVVAADDRPLEDAPKALNCVRVDGPDDVLAAAVHDSFVRVFMQPEIAAVFVGRQQADLFRIATWALRASGKSFGGLSQSVGSTSPSQNKKPATADGVSNDRLSHNHKSLWWD